MAEHPRFLSLEISNIVANYQLGISINIALIARYLPLDNNIVSIKMPGIVSRSHQAIEIISEYDETADGTKYKFVNQCSVTVQCEHIEPYLVNIKIFNNGNLVLTGYRDIKIAETALTILLKSLQQLYERSRTESLLLHYRLNYIKFLEPLMNQPSRAQINRIKRKLQNESFELAKNLFDIVKSDDRQKLLNKFLSDPTNLTILKRYELAQQNIVYEHIQTSTPNAFTVRAYLSFNSFELKISKLQIQNVNTTFRTNFSVDLEATKSLINTTKDMRADYKPAGYPAVNIKYVSEEKEVSILLFKEGGGIITGGRSIAQIHDAYEKIQQFLLTHKRQLITSQKSTDPDSQIRPDPAWIFPKSTISDPARNDPTLVPDLPDLLINSRGEIFLKIR